jgi:hypothetical protein
MEAGRLSVLTDLLTTPVGPGETQWHAGDGLLGTVLVSRVHGKRRGPERRMSYCS